MKPAFVDNEREAPALGRFEIEIFSVRKSAEIHQKADEKCENVDNTERTCVNSKTIDKKGLMSKWPPRAFNLPSRQVFPSAHFELYSLN